MSIQPRLPFRTRHNHRATAVAENIDGGAHHVEDAVGDEEHAYAFEGQANGGENDADGDETGGGDAGDADGGEQSENDNEELLGEAQIKPVSLSDKKCCRAFIQRGSIHIDGRPQRQHERRGAIGDAGIFLHAFDGHRQGG